MDRSTFLGSSDMAAILCVSPWSTPLDIYFEKTGGDRAADDPAKAKIFRRGKRLEPVVVNMLEEERGFEIIKRNERYRDTEYPFLSCEVDAEAMVDGEHVNVECKTAHHFTQWKYGDEDTDQIPIEYAAQAMFSLMITGRRRCIFGVLFGMDNLVTYNIERDEETIASMRAKAVAFWHDHVLARVPPAPVNIDDSLRLFRRDAGSIIPATPEVLALVKEYKKIKEDAAVADDMAEQLKYQITVAMLGMEFMQAKAKPGKHVLVDGARELLTVSLQEQERIDTEALRKRYPGEAKECSKKSSFFTVRLSRKKS